MTIKARGKVPYGQDDPAGDDFRRYNEERDASGQPPVSREEFEYFQRAQRALLGSGKKVKYRNVNDDSDPKYDSPASAELLRRLQED